MSINFDSKLYFYQSFAFENIFRLHGVGKLGDNLPPNKAPLLSRK